jgi:hypothetical protein
LQKTKKYSDADKIASDTLIANQKIRAPKKMKGEGEPVDFIGYEKLKTDMILFQRGLPSIMKSFEVNFSGKIFFIGEDRIFVPEDAQVEGDHGPGIERAECPAGGHLEKCRRA